MPWGIMRQNFIIKMAGIWPCLARAGPGLSLGPAPSPKHLGPIRAGPFRTLPAPGKTIENIFAIRLLGPTPILYAPSNKAKIRRPLRCHPAPQ